MEQAQEQIGVSEFNLGQAAMPPELKQFLFSPAPSAGIRTAAPTPAVDTDIIAFDTVAFGTISVSTKPDNSATPPAHIPSAPMTPASPAAAGPVLIGLPPMPEPEYVFQFELQPAVQSSSAASPSSRILNRPSANVEDRSPRLPEHATAYFRQMLSQFEVFPSSGDDPAVCLTPNPQATAVISRLSAKYAAQTLAWEDIDGMEIALLSVMPTLALPIHSRLLHMRYQESIGAEFSDAKAAEALPPEALRAELGLLLNLLHQRRRLLPEINRKRAQLSRTCVFWTAGLCLLGIAAAGISLVQPVPSGARPLFLLLAALLSGTLGGFTSLMIKTLKTRPGGASEQALEWQTTEGSPFFLPALGAVFAAVLFFLFFAFLSGPFLSGTLAGTSRLMLCGFVAGLAAGLLPDFRRSPKA